MAADSMCFVKRIHEGQRQPNYVIIIAFYTTKWPVVGDQLFFSAP